MRRAHIKAGTSEEGLGVENYQWLTEVMNEGLRAIGEAACAQRGRNRIHVPSTTLLLSALYVHGTASPQPHPS